MCPLCGKEGDGVKITVEIPDREFWSLAERAEGRGVKVADLVRAAARDLARVASQPKDVVRDLVKAGLPDGEISIRTGMTVQTVANHRRGLGLPPNRRAAWVRGSGKPGPSSSGRTA